MTTDVDKCAEHVRYAEENCKCFLVQLYFVGLYAVGQVRVRCVRITCFALADPPS